MTPAVGRQVRHAAILSLLALAAVAVFATLARASSDEAVAALIAREAPPEGVVFEIVSWDGDALEWAVPAVQRYTARLRKRFPGLAVAVVTHGNEMFSLRAEEGKARVPMHAQVRNLVQSDGVPLHVCGTFAETRGADPEAFPKYVDVAPSGPAQVRAYRQLGYTLVLVTRH